MSSSPAALVDNNTILVSPPKDPGEFSWEGKLYPPSDPPVCRRCRKTDRLSRWPRPTSPKRSKRRWMYVCNGCEYEFTSDKFASDEQLMEREGYLEAWRAWQESRRRFQRELNDYVEQKSAYIRPVAKETASEDAVTTQIISLIDRLLSEI